jgi:hypothetical protein
LDQGETSALSAFLGLNTQQTDIEHKISVAFLAEKLSVMAHITDEAKRFELGALFGETTGISQLFRHTAFVNAGRNPHFFAGMWVGADG